MNEYIDLLISISQDQRAAFRRAQDRGRADQLGQCFNSEGDEGHGKEEAAKEA